MDQHFTPLTDFWTSFGNDERYLQPSDVADCSVIQTFNDSIAYGSEPACYDLPSNTFSWEAQPHYSNVHAQTADYTFDKENVPNNYYNFTPYHQQGHVQQNGFWIQAAPEATFSHAAENILSPLDPEVNELTHQLADDISQLSAKIPPELAEDLLQKDDSSTPGETPKEALGIRSPAMNSVSDPPLRGPPCGKVQYDVNATLPCPFCQRSFCRKSNLSQHIYVHHSGLTKELCKTCGKCFHQREKLEKHLLQHQEDHKKFRCEHCLKKYSHKHDLIRHQRHVHSGAPIRCQFCRKTFLRTDHMRTHELTTCKNNATSKTKTRKTTTQQARRKKKNSNTNDV